MNKYRICWSKAYTCSGETVMEADSITDAHSKADDEIGNWEGSRQYHPEDNDIDVFPMVTEIRVPISDTVVTLDGEGNGTITSGIGEDSIESVILAHACAGIDVTAPAYLEGIETAIQAIADNE